VPEGDFGAAPPSLGRSTSHVDDRSVVIDRTKRTTTYENPDGTQTTRVYAAPRHFRDDTGAWKAIDTSIVGDSDRGYTTAAAPTDVSFAPDTDPTETVRIADEGWSLAFGIDGAAAPAEVSSDGSTLTYEDVVGTADLEYSAERSGLKETIILEEPPVSAGDAVWRFPLATTGLSVREGSSGVEFVDGEEEVVARAPDGVMWDSSTTPAYGDEPVRVGLANDGAPALVVRADFEWLTDPKRSYPVFVDPTFVLTSTEDTYVSSSQPTTNFSTAADVRVNSLLVQGIEQIGYMRFTRLLGT
jgi:hypothetical protein